MVDKWYFCLGECGLIITGETSAITASDLGADSGTQILLPFFPIPQPWTYSHMREMGNSSFLSQALLCDNKE